MKIEREYNFHFSKYNYLVIDKGNSSSQFYELLRKVLFPLE